MRFNDSSDQIEMYLLQQSGSNIYHLYGDSC